jgi:hypothetical protein
MRVDGRPVAGAPHVVQIVAELLGGVAGVLNDAEADVRMAMTLNVETPHLRNRPNRGGGSTAA